MTIAKTLLLSWCAALGVFAAGRGLATERAGADRWVLHEWGTFTALQDENGSAIPGINVDDEQLPEFVHNLSPYVLAKPNGLEFTYMKGAPPRHPYATLRLETPVIYFYPPAGAREPTSLDVHVDFRGGWLTEFYPLAEAAAPGIRERDFKFGAITPETLSSLDWRNLRVGTVGPGPRTERRVWTAPRKVRAAQLTAASGESERYLFYRGIGNFDAPLRVTSDPAHGSLELRSAFQAVLTPSQSLPLGPLWLVHVRPDGQVAFRTLPAVNVNGDPGRVLATARGDFAPTDFSTENLPALLNALRPALVADGFFEDEAAAMLATWQQAYFRSAGLRLFFLVPRPWTDYHLPLRCSRPCETQRVMMARVELISPEQRALLARLRNLPLSDFKWMETAQRSPNYRRLLAGRSDFGDLGVALPPDFQAYTDLGRFRNALIVDEHRNRPNANLSTFITAYGLRSYCWGIPDDQN